MTPMELEDITAPYRLEVHCAHARVHSFAVAVPMFVVFAVLLWITFFLAWSGCIHMCGAGLEWTVACEKGSVQPTRPLVVHSTAETQPGEQESAAKAR